MKGTFLVHFFVVNYVEDWSLFVSFWVKWKTDQFAKSRPREQELVLEFPEEKSNQQLLQMMDLGEFLRQTLAPQLLFSLVLQQPKAVVVGLGFQFAPLACVLTPVKKAYCSILITTVLPKIIEWRRRRRRRRNNNSWSGMDSLGQKALLNWICKDFTETGLNMHLSFTSSYCPSSYGHYLVFMFLLNNGLGGNRHAAAWFESKIYIKTIFLIWYDKTHQWDVSCQAMNEVILRQATSWKSWQSVVPTKTSISTAMNAVISRHVPSWQSQLVNWKVDSDILHMYEHKHLKTCDNLKKQLVYYPVRYMPWVMTVVIPQHATSWTCSACAPS